MRGGRRAERSEPARRDRNRWRSPAFALAAAGGLVLLGWSLLQRVEVAPDAVPAAGSVATPSSAPVRAMAPSRIPGVTAVPTADGAPAEPPGERDAAERRAIWEKRLERARTTLESYREATRYPPESRPASEHPDQMEPSAPERRMAFDEVPGQEEDAALFVVLRQDRVFLAGDEAVTLLVRCEDRRGVVQRCEVPPGSAHEAPHRSGAAPLAAVPVPFADDGSGQYVAVFAPAREGFLTSSGTIRIDVEVHAGASVRRAFFDVLYTGSPPATFTGRVEETVAQGSLHLDVLLQVMRAGRYVVTGRVDDAKGNPFAWVQFNEELAPGLQRARLTVFGKLVLDGQPEFPLRLRDLEGFLLRESGDPDRELIPMRAGVVHTTRVYPASAFSSSEWTSEQRERYLEELGNDVKLAEEQLRASEF